MSRIRDMIVRLTLHYIDHWWISFKCSGQYLLSGFWDLPGQVLKLQAEKKTWNDARKTCQQVGGDLVKVKNPSTNQWLAKQDQSLGPLWLGASDQVSQRLPVKKWRAFCSIKVFKKKCPYVICPYMFLKMLFSYRVHLTIRCTLCTVPSEQTRLKLED